MRKNRDLEARLEEWGREYGGGRYETLGSLGSPLASMVKWKGRPPSGLVQSGNMPKRWLSPADHVQLAVEALEAQSHGWLPVQCLRCEYLTPGQPIESKLHRLQRAGNKMHRDRYFQHLRTARQHVASWLHMPYEEPSENISQDGLE